MSTTYGFKTTKPRIFLSPPHLGSEERRFVQQAFESNYIAPVGPHLEAFEREFCQHTGHAHALAVNSGTAAMHLVLRHLGVGPGDEVFAATLTFIGSISPILFQGATPVFIDADRTTWNMDPELLAAELERCARLNSLPRAVVPTDLYGQCCDLDRILDICRPHGVPVIVDAAESLGAVYRDRGPGVGAAAAVFSFNGNKIVTTSGGGMLASDDDELIAHARKLSQQAREAMTHYEHIELGYNYRLSNVLAAIGRGQLRVLADRVEGKRRLFDTYCRNFEGMPGLRMMPEAGYGRTNRWLSVLQIDPQKFGATAQDVLQALENDNIEARPVWKPMHLQPLFELPTVQPSIQSMGRLHATDGLNQRPERYLARKVGGAVAAELFRNGVCLPSGTAMTAADVQRVVDIIHGCQHRG